MVPTNVPQQLGVGTESKFHQGDSDKTNKLCVRLLLASRHAGGIIGKGGAIIKTFREESQAWIDVADSVRGATRRIVTIKGSLPAVLKALHLVSVRLAERRRENARPGDDPPDVKNSLTLLVANAQVGCLIGKAGEQIRHTRELSGSTVKISETTLENSTEKTVSIEGSEQQVDQACKIMCAQLLETQDRAVARIPYIPQAVYPASEPPMQQFTPFVLTPMQQMPLSSGQVRSPGQPQPNQLATSGPNPSQPVQQVERSVVMRIPEVSIGSVLGRSGANIKEIRTRSRAQIKIAEAPTGASERLVTVAGTQQAVETACQMIYEKLNALEPIKGQKPRMPGVDGKEMQGRMQMADGRGEWPQGQGAQHQQLQMSGTTMIHTSPQLSTHSIPTQQFQGLTISGAGPSPSGGPQPQHAQLSQAPQYVGVGVQPVLRGIQQLHTAPMQASGHTMQQMVQQGVYSQQHPQSMYYPSLSHQQQQQQQQQIQQVQQPSSPQPQQLQQQQQQQMQHSQMMGVRSTPVTSSSSAGQPSV